MWQEFKSFAFKGNAFDLAIGVIIGTAFGAVPTHETVGERPGDVEVARLAPHAARELGDSQRDVDQQSQKRRSRRLLIQRFAASWFESRTPGIRRT